MKPSGVSSTGTLPQGLLARKAGLWSGKVRTYSKGKPFSSKANCTMLA